MIFIASYWDFVNFYCVVGITVCHLALVLAVFIVCQHHTFFSKKLLWELDQNFKKPFIRKHRCALTTTLSNNTNFPLNNIKKSHVQCGQVTHVFLFYLFLVSNLSFRSLVIRFFWSLNQKIMQCELADILLAVQSNHH